MTPLFIGGTASHAGKSWFTTAFCRLLRQRGERVAPFKAQNMSNNSYPCIEGGEIGRAQAAQAEACRVPPMADMNPVLLKPCSITGAQVVLQGEVWANVEAIDYGGHAEFLFAKALESYRRLEDRFERIVCEGAGSVAEVNLMPRDITNLRVAEAVGARSLLVASIERGGVFGALAGTLELLPESQRRTVRAFAVNRFHGDRRLFDSGVRFLEDRLGIPCLGVFPYTPEIHLDEEDSVALDDRAAPPRGDNIAVIRFPRISNFTDIAPLEPVDWIDAPNGYRYRAVILPGTKNTLADLEWLRSRGLDSWITGQREQGARVLGICGGYQMLGEHVEDPDRVESAIGGAPGLGLLPARTRLVRPKVTRTTAARTPGGIAFQGYEIHMGRTETAPGTAPFAHLADGGTDGCIVSGVAGTYLHGVFDSPAAAAEYLGMDVDTRRDPDTYDALAAWLREYANAEVLEALTA